MTRNHRVGGGWTPIRLYRWAWLVVCGTLTTVGCTVVLILSPAAAALLFVAFAVVGAVLSLPDGRVLSRHVHGRERARRALTTALVAGTTGPASLGLALALGPGVVMLMLIVGASSPFAVRGYARWLRSGSTTSTTSLAAWAPGFVWSAPGSAPTRLGPELHRLNVEDLCQAWCASYLVLLERASGPEVATMLATVEERQGYLDELERRNPVGLAAWLASGARVASNPLPYFVANPADPPVISWEELTGDLDLPMEGENSD